MLSRWLSIPYGLQLILGVLAASLVAYAVTPLVRKFAGVIGAIDVPTDDRRMHKVPIPRLGGLAIFAGSIVGILLFAELDTQMRGILIGAVMIVVLGCVDDVARIKWPVKLLIQIAAALIAVLHGLRIETFGNPFFFLVGPEYIELGRLSIPVSMLWIIALTNAVNFIDGLDGLACGISLIGSASMLIIALISGSPEVAVLMAAVCGGCLGFLPYNLNPAKLFMGDTGATFLGFILGCASIQGLFKMYALISFAVPFLVLGLPIFDIVMSVLRRLVKRQNPAHADRSHIHHRLIDMGFSQKQAVGILYAISAVLGITAVVLTTAGEVRAIILLVAVVVAMLIGVRVLSPKTPAGAAAPPEYPASEPESVPPPATPPEDAPDAAPQADTRAEVPAASGDGGDAE